ncbi:MAG: LysR family transcriptional regulator [Alphaproteobacteria bacterium]|nr:LysR family transcriptional regulator [Alphaproteobacteria bacterium]MBM3628153.1 LysR family transcriptional regulator [Alphaproteobacteria bacterium]
MDRIVAMRAFAAVAERGSFVAAARALGMSRAMASRHVQDLEAHLGARLLDRTTRRVAPTEAGRVYHERCAAILAELAEADSAVGVLQARPSGRLRVSAPVSFGSLHVAAAVAEYMAAHPQVSIELALNDRVVDLVEEGHDLAIRIGRLAPSSLIARRLAPCRLVACAAPSYLRRAGAPRTPADLAGHECLGYTYAPARDAWRFVGPGGDDATVHVRGRLHANNGDALRVAALHGAGIVVLPSFIVGADLAAGRLRRVLPRHEAPPIAIHAVRPQGRHLSAKVRSFIDFLVPRFGENPEWDAGLAAARAPRIARA